MNTALLLASLSVSFMAASCNIFNQKASTDAEECIQHKWTLVDFPSSKPILTMEEYDSKLFIGTDGDGAFICNYNDSTWTAINSELGNLNVRAFAFTGHAIYAGTDAGVFKTANAGGTWSSANNGLICDTVYSLAILDSTLFAATSNGIFYSDFNGEYWTNIPNLTGSFKGLAAINGVLLARVLNGVYFSLDSGASWELAYDAPDGPEYDYMGGLDPGRCGIITGFAACGSKLLLSEARIESGYWGKDPKYPCYLMVGNIHASEDGGKRWKRIADLNAFDLKTAEGYVFAGTQDGVFYSADCGNSWAQMDSLACPSSFRNIMEICVTGKTIFAAATPDTLYEYKNYNEQTSCQLWKRSISFLAQN